MPKVSPEQKATARDRAWATRKRRYGPSGHSGSYSRGPVQDFGNHPLSRLIAVVHGTEMLTEQQIARITGMDLVAVRRAEDLGLEHLRTKPPGGEWAAGLLRRLGIEK